MLELLKASSFSAFLASIMLILAGCSTRGSVAPPGGVTPTERTPTPVLSGLPLAVPGTQYYRPGRVSYTLQILSVTEPLQGDSIHVADTTRTQTALNIEFTSIPDRTVGDITATIHVDSGLSQHSNDVSVTLPTYTRTFAINSVGRVLREPRILCDSTISDYQQLIRGTEAIPVLSITEQFAWTDTSVVTTCRSTITMHLTRVAKYQILQRNDSMTQLFRETSVIVDGSGIQWGQRVRVSGQGTISDTLYLDPTRLQRITGVSHLELSFTSALRAQRYQQTTLLVLTAR